jgi:hypothetical protein
VPLPHQQGAFRPSLGFPVVRGRWGPVAARAPGVVRPAATPGASRSHGNGVHEERAGRRDVVKVSGLASWRGAYRPTILQGTSQLPIRLDGCTNPRLSGPRIRFDGTSPGSWDAVFVAAILANANNPQIDDVHLISSTGKMRSAVGLYSRTPRTMDNIRVTDVNCAGSVVRAVLLSAGAGSVFDINPIIQAIDNGTDPLWRSEDQNSNEIFPIFPITQGSSARDTERCLEGNVTPNGNVVGNLGDIYRWRPTTTTAEIWFKATQTVAGVRDNTGWVLK